jgi:xanthosine utilization system XapX-like protein
MKGWKSYLAALKSESSMGIVRAVSFGLIFLLLGAIGYVIMAVLMGLLAALLGIVGILVPEILTTVVARMLTRQSPFQVELYSRGLCSAGNTGYA